MRGFGLSSALLIGLLAWSNGMAYSVVPETQAFFYASTGHWYQFWLVSGFGASDSFSWQQAADVAEQARFGAACGHLATLTTQGEYDFVVQRGNFPTAYIGAGWDGTRWIWMTGPETGDPVTFFANASPYVPPFPAPGETCTIKDRVALYQNANVYYFVPSTVSGRCGCCRVCCMPSDHIRFVVEFDPQWCPVSVGARGWGRVKALYR